MQNELASAYPKSLKRWLAAYGKEEEETLRWGFLQLSHIYEAYAEYTEPPESLKWKHHPDQGEDYNPPVEIMDD